MANIKEINEEYQMISLVKFIMGTVFTSQVVVKNNQAEQLLTKVEEVQHQLEDWLTHVDDTFSPYKENSELSRYNRRELDFLQLSDEMHFVIASCLQAKTATQSAFDAEASHHSFDPSGFVKGWAIEVGLKHYLQTLFSEKDIVALNLIGGGDMQLVTKEYEEWQFNIGIIDPNDNKKIIAEVPIKTGAIATSGISERGEHIHGRDKKIIQTTVIGQSLQEVDVWATALMVSPAADLPKYLQSFIVEDGEGYA